MKRLNLILTITFSVLLLIIYFQVLTADSMQPIPFFTKEISLNVFVFYIIALSIPVGFFTAFTIKWFLAKKYDLDDWFDL